MAKVDVGALTEHLFQNVVAPLVLGGPLTPGKPIGGKAALQLEGDRPPVDPEKYSHVQLIRTRRAREIVAIDRLENLSREEWVLAAVLHDILQATHPNLVGVLSKSGPRRLIDIADRTLDHVSGPRTAKEALSRHTLFSRVLEVARTETELRWWTGSAKFIGTEPPARLTAWPELRRVQVTRTPHPLMTLVARGAEAQFAAVVAKFLARSPLTDLATCHRASPPFVWTSEVLALIASVAGRTLALRSLAREDAGESQQQSVDHALGQATRRLFETRAYANLGVVMDLLGERTLAEVQAELLRSATIRPLPLGGHSADATLVRAAGALAAREFVARHGASFGEAERRAVLAMLALRASSDEAKRIEGFLAPPPPAA
jgi:hypothetical protein